VYDVTDRTTFSKLDTWHKEVMESMGDTQKFGVVIVGNKSDKDRVVPEAEARSWCSKKGYSQNYYETSGL